MRVAWGKLLSREMASDPNITSDKKPGDFQEPYRRASSFILNNLLAVSLHGNRPHMTPDEIWRAQPGQAANFLDTGKDVKQEHLQKALSNALKRIDDLERQLESLRKV
jgi:hypothetical protein